MDIVCTVPEGDTLASEAQRPGQVGHPSPVRKPSRQSAARWTKSFTGAGGLSPISCSYLYYYLPQSPSLVFDAPTTQPLIPCNTCPSFPFPYA
jgi:hypothetical protein